jgi:hypothetical protein
MYAAHAPIIDHITRENKAIKQAYEGPCFIMNGILGASFIVRKAGSDLIYDEKQKAKVCIATDLLLVSSTI